MFGPSRPPTKYHSKYGQAAISLQSVIIRRCSSNFKLEFEVNYDLAVSSLVLAHDYSPTHSGYIYPPPRNFNIVRRTNCCLLVCPALLHRPSPHCYMNSRGRASLTAGSFHIQSFSIRTFRYVPHQSMRAGCCAKTQLNIGSLPRRFTTWCLQSVHTCDPLMGLQNKIWRHRRLFPCPDGMHP